MRPMPFFVPMDSSVVDRRIYDVLTRCHEVGDSHLHTIDKADREHNRHSYRARQAND